MGIKNRTTVYDEKVNINRAAIEHRSTWMGLTYEEGLKEGADAEKIARASITKTGDIAGKKLAEQGCSGDLKKFANVFCSDVVKSSFQMDYEEITEDDFKIEFHYCPLVAAWQKLGFDDATCEKLCDIAMDGDRAIARANGFEFTLTDTIAKGCPTCKIHFHK